MCTFFGYRHVPDQELTDFSERICIYGLTIMNSNYEYVMNGMPAQLRHKVFGCMEAYLCLFQNLKPCMQYLVTDQWHQLVVSVYCACDHL